MKKHIIQREVSDVSDNLQSYDPVLRRVYLGRGVTSSDKLSKSLQDLMAFHCLSNIGTAVDRLMQAIAAQESIVIVGDFDVDGATSTALSVRALRAFGATQVAYLIPNRAKDGYGLTSKIVALSQQYYQPSVIITVDNGIVSYEGVDAANERGIDVIITDHHLPANHLPAAHAIVNPNLSDDPFPSKHLSGVGVIFYVMLALRARLEEEGWFEKNQLDYPNMAQLLDLVALGTVADVVPLDKNNRIFVHQGLVRIRAGKACVGVMALLQVTKREFNCVRETDLGFFLGPLLNAAGRLDDMALGVACLLSDDREVAIQMATRLYELNQKRRIIEKQMQREALQAIQAWHLDAQSLPIGLCLYHKSWHQGVVGLIASRLKDRFHRPVLAFAQADDNILKGSGRSIEGFHLRDALQAIANQHSDLLIQFGGHAMAAGLSIPLDRFKDFQTCFHQYVQQHLSADTLLPRIYTDGVLNKTQLHLKMADLIQAGGPWGSGFPEPLFHGRFKLIDQRLVGEQHLKLILRADEEARITLDAIAFNVDLNHWPNLRCQVIEIVYRLAINTYQGCRRLQLLIEYMEAEL